MTQPTDRLGSNAMPEWLNPCKCGCTNLITWWPEQPDQWNNFGIDSMEKIECMDCGRVVYGSNEESIKDWNNQEYCDEPN